MADPHIVIIGGGVAGLAVGCYARASGFRTTIVAGDPCREDDCANVDCATHTFGGSAHCLTGGPFQRVYEELGILPRVSMLRVERFFTYHDASDHFDLTISSALEATAHTLQLIAPEDAKEIQGLVQGVRIAMRVALERADGSTTVRQQLAALWNVRGDVQPLAHFRQPIDAWSKERLRSERLRRVFSALLPEDASALLLLLLLGYLEHGYLSRPVAGMEHLDGALRDIYRAHAGGAMLHGSVDQVLVKGSRAYGVRFAQGTVMDADAVVSTATAAETSYLLRYWHGEWNCACVGQTRSSRELQGAVVTTLTGLSGFFMAGRCVEPGAGLHTALSSGREVVQQVCSEHARPFAAPTSVHEGRGE